MKEAVMKLLNERDGLMLGICNGFQALIKLGLVPYGEIREQTAGFPHPDLSIPSAAMSPRWCIPRWSPISPRGWQAQSWAGVTANPASHGEGRFVASKEWLNRLFANGQVATQYVNPDGEAHHGRVLECKRILRSIEGITSPDGRILRQDGALRAPRRLRGDQYLRRAGYEDL